MNILNLFIVTLVSCAHLKQPTNFIQTAPPPASRQFDNPLNQGVYDDLNYEHSYTETPFDNRGFSATCYILDSYESLVGTGILIKDDVILTAAHVAEHVTAGYIKFTEHGELIPIDDIWLQPEWGLAPLGQHDIALLHLECPVGGITPIKLADKTVTLERFIENTASVGCSLGYKKQSKPLRIFYYGTLTVSPAELKLRSTMTAIWFGDSGGPVLVTKPNGEVFVVGVLVRFSIYQGDTMDFTATDVRKYIGEIETVMENWSNIL